MREACIILPKRNNNHIPMDGAHGYLKNALLMAFDGFSRSECVGSWIDKKTGIVYDDESYMYTVAIDPGAAADVKLREIACSAAVLAQQEAIYYRDAAGDVTIMYPYKVALAAAA